MGSSDLISASTGSGVTPSSPNPPGFTPRIVGIASAGGMEALHEMLPGLPESDRLTYVVAQQGLPAHVRTLAELLAPRTTLHGVVLHRQRRRRRHLRHQGRRRPGARRARACCAAACRAAPRARRPAASPGTSSARASRSESPRSRVRRRQPRDGALRGARPGHRQRAAGADAGRQDLRTGQRQRHPAGGHGRLRLQAAVDRGTAAVRVHLADAIPIVGSGGAPGADA